MRTPLKAGMGMVALVDDIKDDTADNKDTLHECW